MIFPMWENRGMRGGRMKQNSFFFCLCTCKNSYSIVIILILGSFCFSVLILKILKRGHLRIAFYELNYYAL